MNQSTSKKPSTLRKSWLLGASLPAIMLASGLVVTQVHADYDKKDDKKSEARSAGEAVNDGWITTKVKSKLVADQEVSGFDISVETRDKVVYLSGEVEDQSQVSHAVEIAENTQGVKRVDSTSLRIGTAIDQVKDAIDRSSN
jgi:hyperosmotically inducible periplasmic protein